MTGTAIEATGLKKSFGEIHAVDGVDLRVPKGEIYGLVGPDGAGKTTLIRLLSGVLFPNAGKVKLTGIEMSRFPERARAQVGYLAQRFSLYEDLTVIENLRFFAEVRGLPAEDWEPRSREILRFVGLESFVDRRAGQLSGGMKQKLGLAVAMVHQPKILLLDEPTTGVDPVTRQDFWQLIIRLVAEEEVAVIVSTPYMDEASRCMRLGFMRQGRILLEGTPKELRSRLSGQVLEVLGSPLPLLQQAALATDGIENAQRFGSRLHLRIRKGCAGTIADRLRENAENIGGKAEDIRPIDPQLEDVFIALLESDNFGTR